MPSEAWQSSNCLSSNPEEAEKEFWETLDDLHKKGQLDEVARGYFSRTLRDRPSLQIILKFIRDNFPRAWILDLGCGMGSLEAEICRSEKYECVGLDACKPFVHLASLRLKLHGYHNTTFIVGDIRTLPFKMGLFNIVVLHDVAFAVNLRILIGEIAQVLREGGRFLFDAPIAAFYFLIPVQRPFIKYSKKRITNVLRANGFIEERVFLPGLPPALHEHFHVSSGLMRVFFRLLESFPRMLQELLAKLWFNVVFVAKFGVRNAQVT